MSERTVIIASRTGLHARPAALFAQEAARHKCSIVVVKDGLEVSGKSVTTAGDVREALDAARTDNKNSVLMRVKSGGSSRFVAVPLAKG